MYLEKNKIDVKQTESTKEKAYAAKDAHKLLAAANELYVARGKKYVYFDLKSEKPDKATIEKLILGRTGNLRAPALRRGRKLIVGFNEEAYDKVLK